MGSRVFYICIPAIVWVVWVSFSVRCPLKLVSSVFLHFVARVVLYKACHLFSTCLISASTSATVARVSKSTSRNTAGVTTIPQTVVRLDEIKQGLSIFMGVTDAARVFRGHFVNNQVLIIGLLQWLKVQVGYYSCIWYLVGLQLRLI